MDVERSWPRRRLTRRTVIGSAWLAVVAAGFLVAAWLTAGFGQDLLLNLGASFVVVMLSYAIFDPVFEDARKARVEEHTHFDHEAFSARVAACRREVAIMETWTGLLEDRHRTAFLAALRTAVRNRVGVRILLLDPDSNAAEQRAEELQHVDVRRLIIDNLRCLHEFAGDLGSADAERFQVRVYDASPSIQLYQWDDKALISFFPLGVRAYDAPQIEAYVASPWGEFVRTRFAELWAHHSTRTVGEFMSLPLTVRRENTRVKDCVPHFVAVGTEVYVDGEAMVEELADHGIAALRVRTGRPLPLGEHFALVRVDEPEVAAQFGVKYGGGPPRIVLRLVPEPVSSPVPGTLGA